MGISNDALIVYGIDFGEMEDENWSPLLGSETRDDLMAAAEEGEIGLILHCHYDYPMYILGTVILRAGRGHAQQIKVEVPTFHLDVKIKAACEKYGLPYSRPKLLLTSING